MVTPVDGALTPVTAFALVGALGVGSQWLAWKLRLPAIVLMLLAGIVIGPVLGVFDPARDIGDLMGPMISIAVAIILFEGGLTLNFHSLAGAAEGVRRLVVLGAPLGWLSATLALHFVAGLGWESAAVFGGILIVTGPTVIAPLLRTARLQKRPSALLQWEAIVNDPVGALAAVLAFEVVVVVHADTSAAHAVWELLRGIGFAALVGVFGGWGISRAFDRGQVAEYMKVPVLFAALLAGFALADALLHESGLLTVTIMGIWIANAGLPSYEEMRRFKEHATILLVSGVFILLAAGMNLDTLSMLDWRAAAFVAALILIARPLPVLLALAGTKVPFRERLLVALTGPRGVVLVAVAGLFGERLVALGLEDAARIAPLAFVIVAATVVLHGFTLAPVARLLGLTAKGRAGVILVGGSGFSTALGEVLEKLGVPVLVCDTNIIRLRGARNAGLQTFYGDILSESAEFGLDLIGYDRIVALSENDAYNTLVTTDLAPEYGRANVFQLRRETLDTRRHTLPSTLGGRRIAGGLTYGELSRRMHQGWQLRATRLSAEFGYRAFRETFPDSVLVGELPEKGDLRLFEPRADDSDPKLTTGAQVIHLAPPEPAPEKAPERRPEKAAETPSETAAKTAPSSGTGPADSA
ncbi:cation:proton antiporter [Pseudodonghicola flavimaris]|uniref:Sodium:proton antiporter n=1 Tax=Pseudodonghicola flavimaris TaxID=3050036 RepID=A0ABT7EVM3_9RHOB|nr:sodium:proton antiporter [Pseudodonghicola flavimaris]MDK3016340.1 sodium:proton antiporter [Pseudodonghicola flavimaris]